MSTQESVREIIHSALLASDLHSIDAMYQTLDEVASVFGVDFAVNETGNLSDPECHAVELHWKKINSPILLLSLKDNNWHLKVQTGKDIDNGNLLPDPPMGKVMLGGVEHFGFTTDDVSTMADILTKFVCNA